MTSNLFYDATLYYCSKQISFDSGYFKLDLNKVISLVSFDFLEDIRQQNKM